MRTTPDQEHSKEKTKILLKLEKQIHTLQQNLSLQKKAIYQEYLNELDGQVLSWDKELEKYRLKFLLLDGQTQALYIAGGLGAVYITYCILSRLFSSPKKKRSYRDFDYE